MNYPEELRERWNECQFDDRDIIQKFLEKQYDIRYGRQRDTWHFEPAVEVVAHNGSLVLVHDIKLDKDRFVVFCVEAFCEKNAEWECFDFAYGELSKVIEALPDADEINKKNALDDLVKMNDNLRIDLLLGESPFIYNTDKRICWSEFVDGSAFNFNKLVDVYGVDFIVKFRDHINIEVLHRSKEYKELMELLSLQENLRFECQNYGDATFVIDGTDMTFNVSSLRRDDKGNLVIYGGDINADVCDGITLTEKEIKPEYLTSIIECMKPKYTDIMNTYNGHNPELVRKINDAWKNEKYHDSFGDILYAIACRDMDEWKEKYDDIIHDSEDAMYHADEIMEGVCDDLDLKTILNFIRYEEE